MLGCAIMNESSSSFDKNIMCPICLDIFIEPITLLCKHELCKPCYDSFFEKSDFRCPLCKKRLSSWARKAASKKSLVNTCKWKYMQENFSDLIQKRLKGEDSLEVLQPTQLRLAQDGDIRKEYLEEKLKWETEKKSEQESQESASYQLIQKILKEEKEEANKLMQKQVEQDQRLAKIVSEQLNQQISPGSVGKKLLRSTTALSKKVKPLSCKNSIERYCVKRRNCAIEVSSAKQCNDPDHTLANGDAESSQLEPAAKRLKLNL